MELNSGVMLVINMFTRIILCKKKIIRLISGTNKLAHCTPLATNLKVFLFYDLYKYTILCIMYNVFKGSL